MTSEPNRTRAARRTKGRVRTRHAPLLLLFVVGLSAFAVDERLPDSDAPDFLHSTAGITALRSEVRSAFAHMEERAGQLRRAQTIASFARQYRINNSLSADIYAAAEHAGIDPDLAYRLVKLESNFNAMAVSPVGAIGLTQLMLATAQDLDAGITEDQLFNGRTNLRLGLAYLHMMLEEHDGDVVLALASYNRGPGAIRALLAQGRQPNNPYERVILRGYVGKGFLE